MLCCVPFNAPCRMFGRAAACTTCKSMRRCCRATCWRSRAAAGSTWWRQEPTAACTLSTAPAVSGWVGRVRSAPNVGRHTESACSPGLMCQAAWQLLLRTCPQGALPCAIVGFTLVCWLLALPPGDVSSLFPEAAPPRPLLCACLSADGASLAASGACLRHAGAFLLDGRAAARHACRCEPCMLHDRLLLRNLGRGLCPNQQPDLHSRAGEAVVLGEDDLASSEQPAQPAGSGHQPPRKWSPIHVWQR